MKPLKRILRSLSDFIYPPLCLHCGKMGCLYSFCEECVKLLEPIDPDFRCRHCFQEQNSREKYCEECLKNTRTRCITAAVFEKEGPARTLAKEIEGAFLPPLIKAAAGYLAYQFLRLSWDRPEMITIFPESAAESMLKSVHPSKELAKELAKLLNIPFCVFLKATQKKLFISEAAIKRKEAILDKTLLFVSMGQRENYPMYLEVTEGCFPRKIYHLAFLTEGNFKAHESKKEILSFTPTS